MVRTVLTLEQAIESWEMGFTVEYQTWDGGYSEVDSYEEFDELGEDVEYIMIEWVS